MNINKITKCERTPDNLPQKEKINLAEKELIKEKDSVEISSEAVLLSKLQKQPDIRQEKIAEIKRLLSEEEALSKEKIKLGIRKMTIMMFGPKNYNSDF